MSEPLSTEITQFIRTHIDSLEQLEVLLLLHAQPDREWTVQEVYQQVKSSPVSVAARLEALTAFSLLSSHQQESSLTRYKFCPNSSSLGLQVNDLARAYQQRRIQVIETIFAKPVSPLRSFADSFKFKKDPNHG